MGSVATERKKRQEKRRKARIYLKEILKTRAFKHSLLNGLTPLFPGEIRKDRNGQRV